jgi:hypothetical protein
LGKEAAEAAERASTIATLAERYGKMASDARLEMKGVPEAA